MTAEKEWTFRDHPAVAAEVGYLIANLSGVEAWLYMAFAQMIEDDGRVTEAILSGADSLAFKLNIIFKIAAVKADTSPIAAALLASKDDMTEVIKFRNQIAHSVYSITEDQVLLIANAFRTERGKMKSISIDAKLVRSYSERLKAVQQRLVPHLPQAPGYGTLSLRN